MNKNVLRVLLVVAVIGLTLGACATPGMCQAVVSKDVNVGNTKCPVSGDAVDGKTTYGYEGKAYNFCCPACLDSFKADPTKYSKIAEENAKAGK